MDNLFNILFGAGFISLILVNYIDDLKLEIFRYVEFQKAKNILIKFFVEKLKENPDISLDEAILKFEDNKNEFSSLEEFAKSKTRSVECYRQSYSKIFDLAKKKIK